jgi:hypothetical protein
MRPRRMVTHPPRAFPWEMSLPWAATRVSQTIHDPPQRAARVRGSACAKDVDGSTSRAPGTSAIARTRSAAARFTAGRRPGARPSGVRIPRCGPSTLGPKAHAGSTPRPRVKPLSSPSPHPRVVTRLTRFFGPLCDRPGCHAPPTPSPRNPARYCGSSCRQALRNVLDRERKWRSRGTLDGQKKRAYEYQAARQRRRTESAHAAAAAPARAAPD